MKKIITLLLVVALVMTCAVALTACDGGDDGITVAVLAPDPTHDWTGSVGTFAQNYAEEITAEGVYTVTCLTAGDAAAQITQIELITANKNYDAVVILPLDNTVEASMESLVATGIPVVQFDRLIASVEEDVIANISGDNYNIGYYTAERFLDDGLTKSDTILVLEGDDSSVPTTRNAGFWDGLRDADWTDAEITACINNLGSTSWSRDTGATMFASWLNSASTDEIENTKFVFTHDDPIAMGIFDALAGSACDSTKKAAFLANDVCLASSAGALENYEVLAGEHGDSTYNDIYDSLGDYFSVTYAPAMIIDAIDLMIDYLNGETPELYTVFESSLVDSTNVDDFMEFGFGASSK